MTHSKNPDNLTALYQLLIEKVLPFIPKEGRVYTAIECLIFYRHDNPHYSLPCVQPLGIVVALQGRKEIALGSEHIRYDVGQVLFIGANLSGFAYMPECSQENPFLGIALEFDFNQLTQLACELSLPQKENSIHAPNRVFSLFEAKPCSLSRYLARKSPYSAFSRPHQT